MSLEAIYFLYNILWLFIHYFINMLIYIFQPLCRAVPCNELHSPSCLFSGHVLKFTLFQFLSHSTVNFLWYDVRTSKDNAENKFTFLYFRKPESWNFMNQEEWKSHFLCLNSTSGYSYMGWHGHIPAYSLWTSSCYKHGYSLCQFVFKDHTHNMDYFLIMDWELLHGQVWAFQFSM